MKSYWMRMVKLLPILPLLLLNTINCPANYQEKSRQSTPARKEDRKQTKVESDTQSKRPDEVVTFINYARQVPPEFAADLLLHLVESNKVVNKDWKIELLEEAFRLASDVQQPVKRKYVSAHTVDTRAGFLGDAYGLNLDALSLKCKAIRILLGIDKQKARSLFSEMPKLDLKPISCEESLIYDVSDFYATLTDIIQTGFTPKEISRNDHKQFVEGYVSNIVSPSQVEPVVNLLLAMKLPNQDLEALIYMFSNSLRNISSDDRSFFATIRTTTQSLNRLLDICEQKGIAVDDLLKAFRVYVTNHFTLVRCADTFEWAKDFDSGLIAYFNKIRLRSQRNILPISPDEVKPLKIEGEEKVFWHWQSPKGKEFLTRAKRLRFGSGTKPLMETERQTSDWQAEVDDFLKDMASWQKEDEKSEEDYFHQKCHLFVTLLDLIPESPTRDDALRKYIAFLSEFNVQRGSRIEWFWQANYLIRRLKSSTEERRKSLIEKIGKMGNPILNLYIELGELRPKVSEASS